MALLTTPLDADGEGGGGKSSMPENERFDGGGGRSSIADGIALTPEI